MYRYNLFRKFSTKLKKSKKRVLIPISIAGAILIAFLIWFGVNLGAYSDDATPKQVNIRQGMSVEAVADLLHQRKLIRSRPAFIIWARLAGSNIQAGEHLIAPNHCVPKIVSELRVPNNNEIRVTIPSGKTLLELREVFKSFGWTDNEITSAYGAEYKSPILADKPAGTTLEGYIYPDTYNVFISDSLNVLIQKAIDQMYKKVITDGVWTSVETNGMTFYETLTLASIVYKEVGDPTEQKRIAGVLFNRLEAGMRLDADPTFRFAYSMGLCYANNPTCDSEYNTRLHYGLPPGPISTVQISAIDAVVNPIRTGYYYFLAGDDGNIYYAITAEQHEANLVHCPINCSL